jgi:peptidoglycan/xylan/chitin deacetylase (PgdA/CDA1 family)
VRGVSSALYRAGVTPVLGRAVGRIAGPPAFAVLCYHRVNNDGDPFFAALPTRVFEDQVAYVARTHTVLPLEELVERMGRGALPPDGLAITFDDGYRDTLTCAAPILARHRLPATVFLATGLIGTGEISWFDRVALALKATSAATCRMPWGEAVAIGARAERVRLLDRLLGHFKRVPEDARHEQMDQLFDSLGAPDQRGLKDVMLGWDDVHALRGLGFSIGAHTVTHPILSRVSPERARAEIEGSRDAIVAACGRAPASFAYPNGTAEDYTPAVVKIVRDAGFACAVTTRFGLNRAGASPWELQRGGPWERDLPTFALKLHWYRLRLR